MKKVFQFFRPIGFILLFSILFFSSKNPLKAAAKIDSLMNQIHTQKEDTNKLNTYFLIINYYSKNSDSDSIISYSRKAAYLAKKLTNEDKLGDAFFWLGSGFQRQSEYDSSFFYLKKALDLHIKVNSISDIAYDWLLIGNIYYYNKFPNKALTTYKKALKNFEQIQDIGGIANCLINISVMYQELQNNIEALKYAKKAYALFESSPAAIDGQIVCLNTMSTILKNLYEKSVNKNESESITYLEKSLEYIKKAEKLSYKINNYNRLSGAQLVMAELFMLKKDYKNALSILDTTHQYVLLSKSLETQNNAYKLYAQIYDSLRQHDKAYFYLKKHIIIEDSIKKNEAIDKINDLEKEIEKIKTQNQVNNLKQIQKSKDLIITFSLSGIFLLLVISFLIYYAYRNKKTINVNLEKQKKLVEEKNKEITDSIRYAKRIQSAILPANKIINEWLPENFILYQPKDVVSGDFYWLESPLSKKKLDDTTVLFAAADCTGHGVPGAMVSVVCNNALNRSVREYSLTEPGKILDKIQEIVVQEFEKSDEEVKDGMDIALCSLQLSENYTTLQYAGANNPLWIIKPISNKLKPQTLSFELIEYKGNKQPIGKVDYPQPFTNHTIKLEKGDSIYIFTDGYADQFGGPKNKKMMYKPFKELLLSIQQKSMQEQRIILEQHFQNWKGDLEQVDDVCVIGVRI
ncbi:MAG TPA: SpoIIE family protein phosphatase [Vicingaceae bacterium]